MNAKNLGKILACGTLILAGCGNTTRGIYEGHPIELRSDSIGVAPHNVLKIYEVGKDGRYLSFTDNGRDGKVEFIKAINLAKDSPLRKYGSLEEGDKIIKYMLSLGNEIQEKGE